MRHDVVDRILRRIPAAREALSRIPETPKFLTPLPVVPGAVVERGTSIAFVQGDREIASIPKTLFVCLEDVLADWTWDKGASPSLSRDSRPCAQVFPTGGSSSPTRGTAG